MRGRKPKPTELKLLQGTFRQDRAPAAPPPATRQGTPHCPDDFDDEQRAEWKKLARQYRAEGRSIQPHEAGIHVGYVCLTVDLSRARRELRAVEEEVLNLPTAQGLPGLEHALVHAPSHLEEKRDRLLRRIRGLIQEHRSIAAELGLTPSARSRAG
ncbi:MAG: hypothetical protein HGA98_01220, partial [Deltaproteobacteria bacterium]|nr:hypothetical protein [Deltaproteobacteria bacterium]